MTHYAVPQGGQEWLRLRLGKPTASEFHRIITPAKKQTADGKILGWTPTKGETMIAYAEYLLTELILDMPLSDLRDRTDPKSGHYSRGITPAMQSGHDWEPKARAAYEMLEGVDVELAGFCTTDDGLVGASPDGFVLGRRRLLEIKCPFKPEVHVGYMRRPHTLVEEYWTQTQGQLYVTGCRDADIISYFSGMETVTQRVNPDIDFQPHLHLALNSFLAIFGDMVESAKAAGWIKPHVAETVKTRDWLTQEDADAVIAAAKAGGRL